MVVSLLGLSPSVRTRINKERMALALPDFFASIASKTNQHQRIALIYLLTRYALGKV